MDLNNLIEQVTSSYKAPIAGISRHRIATDGDGITTLISMAGCPLDCKFCLNEDLKKVDKNVEWLTPRQLFDCVAMDNLYFHTTNGGLTFSGGEPLLYSEFISKFVGACIYWSRLFTWRVRVETSLNVPVEHVETMMPIVDDWIVDIKDLNPSIYQAYTGLDNKQVLANLNLLRESNANIVIRVPQIDGYNTQQDVQKSLSRLLDSPHAESEQHIPFRYVTDRNRMTPHINGRRTCDILRDIRSLAAHIVGISYTPTECRHRGFCRGTCEYCDKELTQLTEQIQQNSESLATLEGLVKLTCSYDEEASLRAEPDILTGLLYDSSGDATIHDLPDEF